MGREQAYNKPPQTVFQACINAVAYLHWRIECRDESQLTLDIKTKFTMKTLRPSFQDRISVEVIPDQGGARVWVDSSPRFQLWNWGQDERNEKQFIEEVSREVQRSTVPQQHASPGQR